MIKPTVGRVVLYNAGEDQPCAASIAYVYSDNLINIGGFDERGVHFNEQNVHLCQDDEKPAIGQAYWMPYQKGQAAKTEQAESGTCLMEKDIKKIAEQLQSLCPVADTVVHDANENIKFDTINNQLASHQINQPT